MVARDRWFTRDALVLEVLADIESGDDPAGPDERHLAEVTGLSELDVYLAIDALEIEGFIRGGIVRSAFTRGAMITGQARLTGDGRRAIGQWPNPQSVVEQVLASIEQAAEVEPDEEKRGRLRAILAAVAAAGRDLVVDVGAAYIAKTTMPGPSGG